MPKDNIQYSIVLNDGTRTTLNEQQFEENKDKIFGKYSDARVTRTQAYNPEDNDIIQSDFFRIDMGDGRFTTLSGKDFAENRDKILELYPQGITKAMDISGRYYSAAEEKPSVDFSNADYSNIPEVPDTTSVKPLEQFTDEPDTTRLKPGVLRMPEPEGTPQKQDYQFALPSSNTIPVTPFGWSPYSNEERQKRIGYMLKANGIDNPTQAQIDDAEEALIAPYEEAEYVKHLGSPEEVETYNKVKQAVKANANSDNPSIDAGISEEDWATYNRMEREQKEFFNSPLAKRVQQRKINALDSEMKNISEMMANIEKQSGVWTGGTDAATPDLNNPVANSIASAENITTPHWEFKDEKSAHEYENLREAHQLMQEARKRWAAPSKYNFDALAYGKGFTDAMSDASNAPVVGMLNQVITNVNRRNIEDKLNEAIKNGADPAEALTEGEMSLIVAGAALDQANNMRQADISNAYSGGQISEKSLSFMLDFLLTSGVTAATKNTIAKGIMRKLAGAGKSMAPRTARFLGESIGGLVATAGRTALMPSSYANASEKLLEKDEYGDFKYTPAQAWAWGGVDAYIEALSETASEGFGRFGFGKLVDNVFGKSRAGAVIGDFLAGTNSLLRRAGIGSITGEIFEEYYGTAIRSVIPQFGSFKEQWGDFLDADNQISMLSGFALMGVVGAASSEYRRIKTTKDYKAKRKEYSEAEAKGLADIKHHLGTFGVLKQTEIDEVMDKLADMTPDEQATALGELYDKAAHRFKGKKVSFDGKWGNVKKAFQNYFEASLNGQLLDKTYEQAINAFDNAGDSHRDFINWDKVFGKQKEQAPQMTEEERQTAINTATEEGQNASTPEETSGIRQQEIYTQEKARRERAASGGSVSEGTQLEADKASARRQGRRNAIRTAVEQRVGQQLAGDGLVIRMADGTNAFVVGETDTDYAYVDENGNKGTIEKDAQSLEVRSIDDYVEEALEGEENLAEQSRMQAEQEANRQAVVAQAQAAGAINIGTTENPVVAPIVAMDNNGVVLQTPEGNVPKTWQEVADYLHMPYRAKTDAEIVQDRLAQEDKASAYNRRIKPGTEINATLDMGEGERQVPFKFRQAVVDEDGNIVIKATPMDSDEEVDLLPEMISDLDNIDTRQAARREEAAEEPKQPEPADDGILRDIDGDPIPLVEEGPRAGQVNESAFWENKPEAWAAWNDARRNDGGQNTDNYIAMAVGKLQSDIAALTEEYNNTADFTRRDEIEAAIKNLSDRLGRLTSLAESRIAKAEAAAAAANAPATEEAATSQIGAPAQPAAEAPRTMPTREVLERQIDDLTRAAARTKTTEERQAIMEQKRQALEDYYAVIGTEQPIVATRADVAEQMLKAGYSERAIGVVQSHLADKTQNTEGFRIGKQIFIIADDIYGAERAQKAYVHERQHGITKAQGLVSAILKIPGITREELLGIVQRMTGGATGYNNATIETLADEVISKAMELAYNSSPETLVDNLRREGLVNEEIINFVKNIDDEQRRNGQHLNNARSGRRGDSLPAVDNERDGQENGGDNQPISDGLLGQEGIGTDGFGESRTGSPEVQAESGEPDREVAEASPEEQAAQRLNGAGIAANNEEVRLSVRYVPPQEQHEQIINDISTALGVSRDQAERWLQSETSLAAIILDEHNSPFLDYIADDRYTAIKQDSDYPQGTVDFNNICRKRIEFTAVYQRLQAAFPNTIITGSDLAAIRQIMKNHGITVACGLCYVEDRRQLLGEIAVNFIAEMRGGFKNYAKGSKTKQRNAEKFRNLLGNDTKADLSIYDLITLEGSSRLSKEHPGIYNAFQAFNAARGQQAGNLFQGYAEYKREILKWSKKKVDSVNANGGLRIFSYSDFEAHHLIDLVQIIQDCARKGVMIQGYTKVPAFARAVANTGIKLNRSLIPMGDTGIVDGKLAYDTIEGIDINDANFLPDNDNVGNILVGINDEQIRLAMLDPFVHYIIPYHSNQSGELRRLKHTGAWTNYKNEQTEKGEGMTGHGVNIYTDVLAAAEAEGNPIKNEREFVERFLQVCKEKGWTPRFARFLDTNEAGEYVYTPGYYKLLLDFKMFDAEGNILPQKPVVAEFDDEFNQTILENYVKEEQAKSESVPDEVYEEIVTSLDIANRKADVAPLPAQKTARVLATANASQKQPVSEQPSEKVVDNADVDDVLMLSMTKNNRATVETWLGKREDLTDEQRDEVINFIDNLEDSKTQLATTRWFANGNIRLPEDMDKVRQAVSVAGKAKVDPLQYDSPMALLDAHANFKPSEKRINPDEVSTLHRAQEYPEHGIVIYDVDNTEESRKNMRQIINTHFGKDASPWCLLQGDGEGNLTADSKRYWKHYNAYPKQVAFKDGKLLAFSANNNATRLWWDRQDQSHYGVPVTRKVEGDELGRSAHFMIMDGTLVKEPGSHMFRGNMQNGLYEEWNMDGSQILERSIYKDGQRAGKYELWRPDGQLSERGEYRLIDRGDHKIGVHIGTLEYWYDNGQPRAISHFDEEGFTDGEHIVWWPNGNKQREIHHEHGKSVGVWSDWHEDGSLEQTTWFDENGDVGGYSDFGYGAEVRVTYIEDDGRRMETFRRDGTIFERAEYKGGVYHGILEQFHPDGTPHIRTHYNLGKEDGIREVFYPNGQIQLRANLKDGVINGIEEQWNRDGSIKSRLEYENGQVVRDLPLDETPTTAEEQEEDRLLFSFIGEQGAARMDTDFPLGKRMAEIKVPAKNIVSRFLGKQETKLIETAVTRMGNLDIAKQMLADGRSAKAIKYGTGWEVGKDGKWRYEESDLALNEEFFKENQGRKREELKDKRWSIAEVVAHDEAYDKLMAAYPELANIKVSLYNDTFFDIFDANRGYYDETRNLLMLNPKTAGLFGGKASLDELRSVLAHEVQHIIQKQEGFARGGNVDMVGKYGNIPAMERRMDNLRDAYEKVLDTDTELQYLRKERDELMEPAGEYKVWEDKLMAARNAREWSIIYSQKPEYETVGTQEQINDVNDKIFKRRSAIADENEEIKKIEKEKSELFDKIREEKFRVYQALAGEVESRNVSARLDMDEEQKRGTLAVETEDVARDEQIVQGAKYAPAVSTFTTAEDGLAKRGITIDDEALLKEYGLKNLTLSKKGDVVKLDKIVAEEQGKGNGTRFMTDLTSEADHNGWTLALTPDDSFGATSVSRLKNFYKRFGFKDNKGRSADLSISESMIRRPQMPEISPEEEESVVRFSIVDDPLLVAQLQASKKRVGYREMVKNEDGTYSPAIAGEVMQRGKGGVSAKSSKVQAGIWEKADENPDLVDDEGYIALRKTNNAKQNLTDLGKLRYNPYNHLRLDKVNTQFKDAWRRDDLVYVACEVPESETPDFRESQDYERSPYKAEKAALPVGIHNWNGGPLILSRYSKLVGDVPWKEVADDWASNPNIKENGVPFEKVNKALRKPLIDRGIKITAPTPGMGKDCEEAYRQWKKEQEGEPPHFSLVSKEEREKIDAYDAHWGTQVGEFLDYVAKGWDGNEREWKVAKIKKSAFPSLLDAAKHGKMPVTGDLYIESDVLSPRRHMLHLRDDKSQINPNHILTQEEWARVIDYLGSDSPKIIAIANANNLDAFALYPPFRHHNGLPMVVVLEQIANTKRTKKAYVITAYGEYDEVTKKKTFLYGSYNKVKGIPTVRADRATPGTTTSWQIPFNDKDKEKNEKANTDVKNIRFSKIGNIDESQTKVLFDAAKERFGTTTDIREAGYILPDGTMLDFSGRHQVSGDSSFLKGERHIDHRDIADINYLEDLNTPSGLETDMPDFIRRGAIRVDANAGMIDLAVAPTAEQVAKLRRIVATNNGTVWVDFGDGWNTDHSAEYEGARTERVLNDIDRYFTEGYKPEGNLRFSLIANAQESVNKLPDAEVPSDIDLDDVRFSLSKNNRGVIEGWLDKRSDLSDEAKNALLSYLDELDNPTLQLAAAKWFTIGTIRIPEDMVKVEQAVSVARKAKVDPLQYDSPMALLDAHADFKPSEKRINPDDVTTLHRAKEYPEYGVVVYDVDDTYESRKNMREIINSHFGKEASPWCLLQGDGNGKLTEQSSHYWHHYNGYPKQVAFRNGKLLAFSANSNSRRLWWDRQDKSTEGIPIAQKIPNDELGRSATYELNPAGEISNPKNIFRGNRENGVYEEWYSLDHKRMMATYKDGKLNGDYIRYMSDGTSIFEQGAYKNWVPVGKWEQFHYTRSGRKVRTSLKHYDEDGSGSLHGEHREWYDSGKRMLSENYINGRLDGEQSNWYPNGQLHTQGIYENGKELEGYSYDEEGNLLRRTSNNGLLVEEFSSYSSTPKRILELYPDGSTKRDRDWHSTGKLAEEIVFEENGRKGEHKLWDVDGNLRERYTLHNRERDGLYETWNANGTLELRGTYDKGWRMGVQEIFDNNGDILKRYEIVSRGVERDLDINEPSPIDGKVYKPSTDERLRKLYDTPDGGRKFKGEGVTVYFSIVNERQDIFVSNAAKAVEDIKNEKATPEQWLKMLEKNGGLKAGEDKWIGLSDWLKEQDKKTLTKQDVLDFINQNKIQIEETRYAETAMSEDEDALESYQSELDELAVEGEDVTGSVYTGDHYDYAWQQMVERYGDDFELAFEMIHQPGAYILKPTTDWNEDLTEAAAYFLDKRRGGTSERINETRLTYTTEGLDNKREIALTVPTITPYNETDKVHFGDAGEGRAIAWVRFGDTFTGEMQAEDNYRKSEKAFDEYQKELQGKYLNGERTFDAWFNKATPQEQQEFWRRHQESSRLYDIWKEKKYPKQNILVIDEIQSKRHQDAREKGYRTEEQGKVLTEFAAAVRRLDRYTQDLADYYMLDLRTSPLRMLNELDDMIEHSDKRLVAPGSLEAAKEQRNQLSKLIDERNALKEEREEVAGKIPAAPFEKNWHELAMKRMLRLAAEEGYDYLAWTTGEQQAERYDLSTVINYMRVVKKSDGNYIIIRQERDGTEMESFGNITPEKLPDIVGKELAQKITNDEGYIDNGHGGKYKIFSGLDLKIGGEGMKGFYDDILPRFVNKYGKKWGISVSDMELPIGETGSSVMHSIPITDQMKEDVMEGQPMFSMTGKQVVESVDKNGLESVVPADDLNDFYRDVYEAIPADIRKEVVDRAMENGLNFRQAMKDYLAEMAARKEDTTGLVRMAGEMIRPFIEGGESLSDNDIHYILWRGNTEVSEDMPLTIARNEAMKRRFANEEEPLFSLTDGVQEAGETAKAKVEEAGISLDEQKKALKGDLLTAAKAMSAQKQYDQKTVDAIVTMAKDLLKDQQIPLMTRREVARVLGIVKASVGKNASVVRKNVEGLVDLVIDHLMVTEKAALDKLRHTKATKVNTGGVQVQGTLDVRGQRILKAFNEGIEDYKLVDSDDSAVYPTTIAGRMAELTNAMASKDDAVREEAEAEYYGLALAREYHEQILDSKAEEKVLKDNKKEAESELKAGRLTRTAYNEFIKSTDDSIRENHVERVEAFRELQIKLHELLAGSSEAAAAFRQRERDRINDIHHLANSDMQGRPVDPNVEPTRKGRFFNSALPRFLLSPLATFDQMLRLFGSKNVNGEGYLWNKFHRGWVEATENEFLGKKKAHEELDRKMSEVFGKKMLWSDIYKIERNMPKAQVTWWTPDGMKSFELTQGNLLYIYMVNKMADGKMKLRRMGITEEDVAKIKDQMDSRFIELADWLQDEFLVNLRNKYNAVHERMFGASMSAIENYFPLRINTRANESKEDVNTPFDLNAISSKTGAIIKRKRNGQPLDLLDADAFSVVIEHVDEMENWAAFAELKRDLSTLLSHKRFRNAVMNMNTVYGAGKDLWDKFRDVCSIAVGTYRPAAKESELDKAAVNIAKGVTSAKIAFRVYTALKQVLSAPAFIADANPIHLAANLATPWKSWQWALENLPVFEKRLKSRIAGDTRLMNTESDWKFFRSNTYQFLSRIGMSPNAFVDALTCSIGAHSIYQTRYDRYIKDGYTEEQADKKAKQDATTLYNETQQSSEGAFVSAAQVDRTWMSSMITVFRNSSMGYQRQLHDALRNYGKIFFTKGYKEQSIEFMAKQKEREGLTEEQARAAAERDFNRETWRSGVRIAVFGYVMQLFWNMGSSLAYQIFGGDDKKKKKYFLDSARHALFGGIEGLAGGNLMSDVLDTIADKDKKRTLRNFDPSLMPLVSDIKRLMQMMSYDKMAAYNEIVNLGAQIATGVNLQTFTDNIVAIIDACNGDLDTSKEAMILIMRVLQVPQSQVDEIFIDELGVNARSAKRMTQAQMAERYARYKIQKNAPLTEWAYIEGDRAKREKSYKKKFKEKVKERKELDEQ